MTLETEGKGPPVITLGPRAPRYQLGTYRRWLQLENLQAIDGHGIRLHTTMEERTA